MGDETPTSFLLGWLVAPPEEWSAEELAEGTPVYDSAKVSSDAELRQLIGAGQEAPPVLLKLSSSMWGLAGTMLCARGLPLFEELCAVEGLEDRIDYWKLAKGSDGPADRIVLVKQDLFVAFLCRAQVRQRLLATVRPLLGGEGNTCLFDQSGTLAPLASDEVLARHYLELLLGRGTKSECPQAEQYLQGIARDMMLDQLPYHCAVLGRQAGCRPEETVLNVLTKLDAEADAGGPVAVDLLEDLALAVAAKALELVSVLGLDL